MAFCVFLAIIGSEGKNEVNVFIKEMGCVVFSI